MSRAAPLTLRERELVGDALRGLREANELNQRDVASHFGIQSSAVFNYENGRASLSATRALDLLRSLVATGEDKRLVQSLSSAVPDLGREVRFQESVEQAEREGKLQQRGTAMWIADVSGIAPMTVFQRLHRRRQKKD